MKKQNSKNFLSSRRHFVQGSLSLIGSEMLFSCHGVNQSIPGHLYGPNFESGHQLRQDISDDTFQTDNHLYDTLIVGGGVSGLSAARALSKQNRQNFLLLELEENVGGNSRFGTYGDKKFPWGAHYLPIPLPHWQELIAFLEESNLVAKRNDKGEPVYREEFLCHEPQERLLIYGHWQSGMLPRFAQNKEDHRQFQLFSEHIRAIRDLKSSDGKRYFDFPLSACSREGLSRYDSITMQEWMDQQGFTSKYLRWYVNYCCKDDYATEIGDVSAWAALQYFASRTESSSQVDSAVLTWPEGNGFLINKLRAQIPSQTIRSNALVTSVKVNADNQIEIIYQHQNKFFKAFAKNTILAVPSHVRRRILKNHHEHSFAPSFSHAPWVTAAVYLNQLAETKGSAIAWDNVSFHSSSLGYIFSDHQNLSPPKPPYILTYYSALTGDPRIERMLAGSMQLPDWQRRIVDDLSKMHPEIRNDIVQLDVWIWGHGMIRPIPGLISENHSRPMNNGPVYFAHTDDGGISVFEEAFYRGLHAANAIAKRTKESHA